MKNHKTEMTSKITLVTPELATNLLLFNRVNRRVNEKNFEKLVRQMNNDDFKENGESIVFDRAGNCKDGQHRLLAIEKTGKSYWMCIVRNVKGNVMATYDTGKSRSAGDVLELNGFKYSGDTASAIQVIHKWVFKKSRANNTHGVNLLTNQQVLDYCSENYHWIFPMIKKCAGMRVKCKPQIMTSTQLFLLAYMIGGENPKPEVWDFLEHIIGLSRVQSSAPNYLYNKLFNAKINKEPLNWYWILGMALKAWNYYTDGNPAIKFFRFNVEMDLPKINK